jgi:uncharacterized membrane protein
MEGNEFPHLLFRWIHVLAGVMWIGQIWSLTLIHQLPRLQPGDPATSRPMVRALDWLRGAAGIAWLTGIALLGIVYYGGGALTGVGQSKGPAMIAGLAVLFGGAWLYDRVWTLLDRHRGAAAILSLSILTGTAAALPRIMTGRAAFIHLGAMLATIIGTNVWQRICPIERRRFTATDPREQPPADAIAAAALRLRHNAALAVAVIFFMISNHFPLVYGSALGWAFAPAIVVTGWLLSGFFYLKAEPPLLQHV